MIKYLVNTTNGDKMKKICLFIVLTLLLVGCSMSNSPTSKVEDLFMKYQKVDNDIELGIDNVVSDQNLSDSHKERYRKLLKDQYQNLSYEIKDELIDGDNATVLVEMEVIDYKRAINDLTFDSSIYTKESYDEEKLNRLEKAHDKVKYTLEIKLTKDDEGVWKVDALTNEQIKKIQGMY